MHFLHFDDDDVQDVSRSRFLDSLPPEIIQSNDCLFWFFLFYFFFSGFTLCDQVTTNRQRAGRKTPSRIETKPERLIHTPSHLASVQTLSKYKKKKKKEMRGGENLKLHTLFGWVGGGVKVGATGVCLSCWGNKKKIYSKAKAKANALARNWQLG